MTYIVQVVDWGVAIKGFRCNATKAVFEDTDGGKNPDFHAFRRVLERKLLMLDAASKLEDLRSPPGNRLEALVSDRAGQHSIRVNQQYRLCFRWTDAGPVDVECVDYH